MISHFTILLAGFTVFSAAVLLFAYWFFLPDLQKSFCSKVSCTALLAGLSGLQWCHYLYLAEGFDALNSRFYLTLLLLVPCCFYYFSRFVLFPNLSPSLWQCWHFLPVIIGSFLPNDTVPPFAFLIGTVYTFWFARLVFQLRNQHRRFKFEIFFFGLFAFIAIIALGLGLSIPHINPVVFYITYGNATGIAMLLVVTAIVIFPSMLSDIQQVAEIAYAKTKLGGIDVEAKKAQLESLMQQESHYQNEKLGLAAMANMMDISAHQLSELVNTQYGYGFSRFVREQRITQAKKLLENEPKTSILAISIMTGFQSQSNFYSAFKEIAGESPGSYRKKRLKS
ncbi:MAG: helix-turn-helix domain-containing protein [Cellvibrionaceae bacterium]